MDSLTKPRISSVSTVAELEPINRLMDLDCSLDTVAFVPTTSERPLPTPDTVVSGRTPPPTSGAHEAPCAFSG